MPGSPSARAGPGPSPNRHLRARSRSHLRVDIGGVASPVHRRTPCDTFVPSCSPPSPPPPSPRFPPPRQPPARTAPVQGHDHQPSPTLSATPAASPSPRRSVTVHRRSADVVEPSTPAGARVEAVAEDTINGPLQDALNGLSRWIRLHGRQSGRSRPRPRARSPSAPSPLRPPLGPLDDREHHDGSRRPTRSSCATAAARSCTPTTPGPSSTTSWRATSPAVLRRQRSSGHAGGRRRHDAPRHHRRRRPGCRRLRLGLGARRQLDVERIG